MGGKFKFSAQDRDLEYLFWRSKNLPIPSDIIPPLCTEEIEGKGQKRGPLYRFF